MKSILNQFRSNWLQPCLVLERNNQGESITRSEYKSVLIPNEVHFGTSCFKVSCYIYVGLVNKKMLLLKFCTEFFTTHKHTHTHTPKHTHIPQKETMSPAEGRAAHHSRRLLTWLRANTIRWSHQLLPECTLAEHRSSLRGVCLPGTSGVVSSSTVRWSLKAVSSTWPRSAAHERQ